MDGTEIRIPEGSLAVKDPDAWRFLSPRPLINKKLPFDCKLDNITIKLKQAALPIKTVDEEDRVLVFRRKGTTLYVTLEQKPVDVTVKAQVPVCRGIERRINYACIPVNVESTIRAISRKVNARWNSTPTICHSHRGKEFYGLEFSVGDTFDTAVASLQKIVLQNSRLVRRIHWGLFDNNVTFQLWFKKTGIKEN
jgi:hypothetical protein